MVTCLETYWLLLVLSILVLYFTCTTNFVFFIMNKIAILFCALIAVTFGKAGDASQPEIGLSLSWDSSDSGVPVVHSLNIMNLLPLSNNSQLNLLKDIKVSVSSSYSNALAPLAFYFPDQPHTRLDIAPGATYSQRLISFTSAVSNPNYRPQYSIRVAVSYLSSQMDVRNSLHNAYLTIFWLSMIWHVLEIFLQFYHLETCGLVSIIRLCRRTLFFFQCRFCCFLGNSLTIIH